MKEAYRLLRRIKERVLLRLVFVLGEDRRVFLVFVLCAGRTESIYFIARSFRYLSWPPNVDLHAALARSRLAKRESRISVSFATSFAEERQVGWRVCGVTSTRGLISRRGRRVDDNCGAEWIV